MEALPTVAEDWPLFAAVTVALKTQGKSERRPELPPPMASIIALGSTWMEFQPVSGTMWM